MSVVVGTAGHIDHGKTTLLRALTGIDADRLPEERRRGMTIDVGYAHLALPDGDVLDFVDVPGHDRLVGNMLVGAGEIDAAMLVVAADDGPRAQTLEHLELLDALGIADGIAVVTKADLLAADDPRRAALAAAVEDLLARTSLAGSPVLLASATTGEGLDEVRAALVALRDRVRAGRAWGGRALRPGATRGGPLVRREGARPGGHGDAPGRRRRARGPLRALPGGGEVRVREVQVRGATVERAADGGRVALNLAGDAAASVARGDVLVGMGQGAAGASAEGPAPDVAAGAARPVATRRLLVAIRPAAALAGLAGPVQAQVDPGADGATFRLHVGTAGVDATVRRSRADVEMPDGTLLTRLHLAAPTAVAPGDRLALRRPSPGAVAGGGVVLDPLPPTGPSRRHADAEAVRALSVAQAGGDATARAAALLALHGALPADRVGHAPGVGVAAGPLVLSPDVASLLDAEALAAVEAAHAGHPEARGIAVADLRRAVARALRRRVTATPAAADAAAASIVAGLVATGRLAREGDVVRDATREAGPPPALAAAMDRLVAALSTAAPPPFAEAVRAAGCPPDGVRELERSGRIVRLEPELAFAAATYADLTATALAMAAVGPLTPAAFRDATGSSRKYALAILEDLDRRQVLRRGPDGHVPGPRAPRPSGETR